MTWGAMAGGLSLLFMGSQVDFLSQIEAFFDGVGGDGGGCKKLHPLVSN